MYLGIFLFLTVAALMLIAVFNGYALHLGNPDPVDRLLVVLLAIAGGALGTGGVAVVWEAIHLVARFAS